MPLALAKRDELAISEAATKQRLVAENLARQEARDKALAEREQYEQDQLKQRAARVDSFRRGVKIETKFIALGTVYPKKSLFFNLSQISVDLIH